MNLRSAYEETEAVISPVFGGEQFWSDSDTGTATVGLKSEPRWKPEKVPLRLDQRASRWMVPEVIAIAVTNATVSIDPVIVGDVSLGAAWPGELAHRFSEGRNVNSSTYALNSRSDWSLEIESVVIGSPGATTPAAVPEAIFAIPDLLAGYEGYANANWDCYGAESISAETVDAARQLLDMLPGTLGEPHISPGSDGTIGFEWVFADGPLRKLFIDVGPGRVWTGYWRRASGEKQTLLPRAIDARTEAELGKLFDELSA